VIDPNLRLDPRTQAEVDARIARMRDSLPGRPTVAHLVTFAEALDSTLDPNVRRIRVAAQTLVAYQRLTDPESWEDAAAVDAVTDTVVGLMHFCATLGADFDVVLAGCRESFAEESVNPWL
jgi:hypothetical protein